MPVQEVRRRRRRPPNLRTIAVTIEDKLFDKIEDASLAAGLSRSFIVSELIREALEVRDRAS